MNDSYPNRQPDVTPDDDLDGMMTPDATPQDRTRQLYCILAVTLFIGILIGIGVAGLWATIGKWVNQ